MLAAGAALMELRNEYAIWGDSQGSLGVDRSGRRGVTLEGKRKTLPETISGLSLRVEQSSTVLNHTYYPVRVRILTVPTQLQ